CRVSASLRARSAVGSTGEAMDPRGRPARSAMAPRTPGVAGAAMRGKRGQAPLDVATTGAPIAAEPRGPRRARVPAQTLGDLVKLFEAEGRAALLRALDGAPALVVRVGVRETAESSVNTATFSLAETHEGNAMGAWAGATANSQVV